MRTCRMPLTGAAIVAAAGLAIATAPSAQAADTTVTFSVTAGALTLTAPATATIGGAGSAPGTTISGTIGPVTVDDARASATPDWIATVTGTDFSNGTTTIPVANVSYFSADATSTTGTGTFTAGQPASGNPGNAITLTSTGQTAFSHTGGTGNNSATWNPTLQVAIPADATDGTDYTGTVTQNVA